MCGRPALGDRLARGDPHPRARAHVLDEPLEGPDAAGPADDPEVDAERHHPRRPRALVVEHVERVDGVRSHCSGVKAGATHIFMSFESRA